LPQQRGRVIGFIQTAFAASQIMGLPAGIYLSNHWDWHAPFLVMVVFGIVGGLVVAWKLQPVVAHLKERQESSPWMHLYDTVREPRHWSAFVTMMPSFFLGGTYVLMRQFDPEETMAAIERERVTHVMLVPAQIVALLQAIPLSAVTEELPGLLAFLEKALKVSQAQLLAALTTNFPGLAQSITNLPTVTSGWNNVQKIDGATRFDGTPVKTVPASA